MPRCEECQFCWPDEHWEGEEYVWSKHCNLAEDGGKTIFKDDGEGCPEWCPLVGKIDLVRRPLETKAMSAEMVDESQAVKASMAPMFRESREKKLWFFMRDSQIWFSPEELAAQHAQGKFLFGAVNWRLRDPEEAREELDRKIADAQAERDRFVARLCAA